MRNLAAYLRARRLLWLVLVTLLIIACGLTYLENLPPVALLDGVVISAAVLVPILAVDAWHWCAQLALLQATYADAPLDHLPAPQDAQIERYQQLLAAQFQTKGQAQADAAGQMQTLSDHFALWSHQMKTPLAALDLLLQVPPVKVAAARGEVKRIERYVQMMLTYLKFNDVNRDLVLRETALTPLVNQVVRDLADLFIEKNLAVQVDALPTIVTDSQWFKFILEQLLTNAAKYTETGGVHVYAQGDAVVVADSGIGIAASDLPRLFEPGFSGYNGRMNQKASGLGLSMSQTIATQLGLKLSVSSQIGQGTKVFIHLTQQSWPSE
ncbi:sensor histidine kinase [Lacticaseibacillus jixiensis]|uniref:sensor histidine kinase n=1 Tax=Lacticaseibacillus jixiensis TaxID=3231926 RepID=UPI0036F289BB